VATEIVYIDEGVQQAAASIPSRVDYVEILRTAEREADHTPSR
jgi:hypothetical protein